MKKCCICKKEFDGFSNNANPIKNGICCDECNMRKVIPRRLKSLRKLEQEKEE